MKVHYFQRYHSKENVATANTMLLLSRLYSYSSDMFFQLLKTEYFSNSIEPELVFNLQEKTKESVADATITQEGFKIIVETKLSDWFYSDQLKRHLSGFEFEKNKVLISIAPEPMAEDKLAEFEKLLQDYNKTQACPVVHINTTFAALIAAIQDLLGDKDYEMLDVLEDYTDYCRNDHLLPGVDSWKWMRAQLTGTTFNFNLQAGLYYDNLEHGFSPHDYLGLYTKKSVRAIGKITDIIAVQFENGNASYKVEKGSITEEKKQMIADAVEDGKKYGYDMLKPHRFFFVEKFYETDFKKITKNPPRGSRMFDLTQVLGVSQLPSTEEIAELLRSKTWN